MFLLFLYNIFYAANIKCCGYSTSVLRLVFIIYLRKINNDTANGNYIFSGHNNCRMVSLVHLAFGPKTTRRPMWMHILAELIRWNLYNR